MSFADATEFGEGRGVDWMSVVESPAICHQANEADEIALVAEAPFANRGRCEKFLSFRDGLLERFRPRLRIFAAVENDSVHGIGLKVMQPYTERPFREAVVV